VQDKEDELDNEALAQQDNCKTLLHLSSSSLIESECDASIPLDATDMIATLSSLSRRNG
jgi:hypothetical protein